MELILHHNHDVLERIPFFKKEDGNFVSAVLMQLKPLFQLPDVLVYKQVWRSGRVSPCSCIVTNFD